MRLQGLMEEDFSFEQMSNLLQKGADAKQMIA
jgi:hypothetical protein